MSDLYDFAVTNGAGEPVSLADHRGKVVLVVNTASKCGFTPQYEGLEALYKTYGDKGLVVLGFPCNQFGHQEPGDAAEIANFCKLTYEVDFPMFAKVEVNGPGAIPLYQWLKREAPGIFGLQGIKWNFTKFLIDREGKVRERFAPATKPADLTRAVEALL